MAGIKGMKHSKLKYNSKTASMVIELMEQGNTLSQVCDILSKEFNIEGLKPYTILSWRRNYPEFKEEYEIAYDSRSAMWTDELYAISSEPFPVFDNKLELSAEIQRRRFRLDVLKVLLNKHRPTPTSVPASPPKQKSSTPSAPTFEIKLASLDGTNCNSDISGESL